MNGTSGPLVANFKNRIPQSSEGSPSSKSTLVAAALPDTILKVRWHNHLEAAGCNDVVSRMAPMPVRSYFIAFIRRENRESPYSLP